MGSLSPVTALTAKAMPVISHSGQQVGLPDSHHAGEIMYYKQLLMYMYVYIYICHMSA